MMPPTFFAGPPIAAVAEVGRTIPVPLMTALPAVLSLDATKLMLFCRGTPGLNTLARRGALIPIAFVAVPAFLAITLSLLVIAMPAAFFTPSAPFGGLLLAIPEPSCVSMPIEFRGKPAAASLGATGPRAARRLGKFFDGLDRVIAFFQSLPLAAFLKRCRDGSPIRVSMGSLW
ncbi:MAG TPA: hypothetical protein VKB89_14065 [Xanthobacteraceae bacterium]|nr:hypothetical protein [Xanthobacteraceae bacterium]